MIKGRIYGGDPTPFPSHQQPSWLQGKGQVFLAVDLPLPADFKVGDAVEIHHAPAPTAAEPDPNQPEMPWGMDVLADVQHVDPDAAVDDADAPAKGV